MDILQQCQKWHENDEYQKIIDALEAIPAQERTPEEDSELARACNNLADPGKPDYSELLRKAIALLEPHAEYFAGEHFWNFRMGYSYYYLNQEGIALGYFEKALEARPDDEDTKEFISWCQKGISWPQFSGCFRERTEICGIQHKPQQHRYSNCRRVAFTDWLLGSEEKVIDYSLLGMCVKCSYY